MKAVSILQSVFHCGFLYIIRINSKFPSHLLIFSKNQKKSHRKIFSGLPFCLVPISPNITKNVEIQKTFHTNWHLYNQKVPNFWSLFCLSQPTIVEIVTVLVSLGHEIVTISIFFGHNNLQLSFYLSRCW